MGVMPEQCLLNVRYMQRQCIVPIKRLSVLLAAYCCIIRRNLSPRSNTNTGEQSLEEQLYNSIILIDEDENEIEFDIMDIIEHNGENYYVLLPVDDDSDELEYVILRETGEGEEKTLVGIDDEKTLDDVFKKYQKHSTDEN